MDGVQYESYDEAMAAYWGWYGNQGDTSAEGIEKAIRKYAQVIVDSINKYDYDGFDIDYEPNFSYGGNISITVKISNRTASRTFHANTDSNHRFTGYCILHLSLPIDLLCLHVQRTKQKATKTEERKIKSVPFHKHYF